MLKKNTYVSVYLLREHLANLARNYLLTQLTYIALMEDVAYLCTFPFENNFYFLCIYVC